MLGWIPWVLFMGCGKSGPFTTDEAVADEGTFSVLTYNVHGLPSLITGDDTPGRMAQIAPLLVEWDILGLQEDWDGSNHQTLMEGLGHETKLWFDDSIPGRVYGSGLSTAAHFEAQEIETVHYSTCEGTLDGASDCLASKGFQATRLSVGGATVDFYNTHLEAGGGEADEAARLTQVEELLAFMSSWSSGRAIVFTGDFNLHARDIQDAQLLERLEGEGGLTDSCEAVGCEENEHIDRVWLRSSDEISLNASEWENVSGDFMDADGIDLSDHPPISVQIDWLTP